MLAGSPQKGCEQSDAEVSAHATVVLDPSGLAGGACRAPHCSTAAATAHRHQEYRRSHRSPSSLCPSTRTPCTLSLPVPSCFSCMPFTPDQGTGWYWSSRVTTAEMNVSSPALSILPDWARKVHRCLGMFGLRVIGLGQGLVKVIGSGLPLCQRHSWSRGSGSCVGKGCCLHFP